MQLPGRFALGRLSQNCYGCEIEGDGDGDCNAGGDGAGAGGGGSGGGGSGGGGGGGPVVVVMVVALFSEYYTLPRDSQGVPSRQKSGFRPHSRSVSKETAPLRFDRSCLGSTYSVQ